MEDLDTIYPSSLSLMDSEWTLLEANSLREVH